VAGNATLHEQYPTLNNIVPQRGDTINKVFKSSPPNVTFKRDLVGPRLASWNTLLRRLVQLTQGIEDF
jgi:hypothetical protein